MDNDVLRRVRKLLDKAERTSNEHEAEAFARKAADLVARYRIDPDRLTAARADDLEIRRVVLGRGAYVRARLSLLMAVGAPHDVSVVFETTPSGTIALLAGFGADLDVTEMMYQSLHQQAASQMATIHRGTPAATQRFRRSFLFGYADRIRQILRESRQVVEDEAGGMSRSTTIALRERADMVDDFLRQEVGGIRTARPVSGVQANGWQAGSEAAQGADVGRARIRGRAALGSGS